MQHKSEATKQHWEDAEFPILCQTCLGDNPYIRMTKERFGKECKICTRPFTVFRWCPGKNARFKKTEVCQTCAKLKNVCQTCIFDLEYGLPVEVRDKAMGMEDNVPKSEVNREYYAQNQEALMANVEPGQLAIEPGYKADSALLQRFARSTPYYKRNRAHICSFWVKGECKRGEECPYRHEMPTDPNDPLAKQNIKDRYYGQNDPVAAKIFDKARSMPKLEPPSDRTVMTLFVGGVTPDIKEQDLRDFFYQYGQLDSIRVVERQACAFITYASRSDAETAAARAYNNCVINGRKLRIMWGRSQSAQSGEAGQFGGIQLAPVPNLPVPGGINPAPPMMGGVPGQPPHYATGHPPPPPQGMPPGPPRGAPPGPPPGAPPGPPPGAPPRPRGPPTVYYPSQDPQRLGTNRRAD